MSFTYRGTTSDSMFFNVTERQVYNAPAFDVNAIEVPGRSGDVLNSQQRFKNKTLVYTGFIRSSDFPGNTQWERLSRGLRNIKAWICGDAGKYHDLTDDYDPGFIRRAFVSGETAINILFDRPDGATITITFMAEPFMYEVSEPMELPETKSASGSIITITDGADNTPLKSAVVNIEPVQDLHGYDYPWPAGGGYNILPDGNTISKLNDAGLTVTLTDTTLSGYTATKVAVTGTAASWGWRIYTSGIRSVLQPGTTYKITFLASAAYTFVGMIATTGSGSKLCGSINFTRTQLSNGLYEYAGTFTTYASTDAGWSASNQVLLLYLNPATTSPADFTIVNDICLTASTAPDGYYAYSNICPISGWSQVDGARAGGNLMPGFDSGLWGTADTMGWTISNFSPTPASFPFDMPAGKYTGVPAVKVYLKGGVEHSVSASPGKYWCISYYDRSGNKISNGASGWGIGTFTPPVGTAYAIFGISNYQGTATTLTTSTQVQIAVGSSLPAWTPYKTVAPINIALGQTVYGGTLDVLRGKLNVKPYYASYSGQTLVGPWISSHDKYVAGATPTTGAQVVDMGAAGTDYDVTPQTIKTLLGVNNIWANTGETEVEYIVPTENPTQWPSQPRLEITMSGAGTLTVNGKTWSIGSYTGTLICDSEIMDWYDAGALKNSLVSGDGFPELVPGDNVITYTGGITKVVATPRWRTL